jgi:surfactin synthase thioesterase subunit
LVEEPFWPNVGRAVASLVERVPRHSPRPYVLFGHSLGALLAFELARELRRRGYPSPALLIVSGARAPEYAASIPTVSDLSDDEFVAAVSQRYALLPQELLRDPPALKYYTDLMRADIRLVERYAYCPSKPLDCDIEVLCGRSDPLVTDEMAQAWSAHARRARVSWYEGDHFFIHQSKTVVIDHIRHLLLAVGLSGCGIMNVAGGVS